MDKGFISRRLTGCFCGLAALLSAGCADEELPGEADVALKEGEISLQWEAPNMGTHVSRGTDTKTGEERQINNVHIFLFDEYGKYLEASNEGRDAFQGYRRLDNGGTNWILQTRLFNDQNLAEKATVYVLANVPEGYFADGDNDGRPDDVKNITDLDTMTIRLPTFTTNIPEGGLPMVLKRTEVDLSDDAQSKIVTLQLRSMMARIDLNFTMNPLQGTVGNLPSLEFHAMRVGKFPKGGKVKSQLVSMEDGTTGTGDTTEVEGYGLTNLELTDSPILNRVLRSGSEQSVTFYMFEHARTAKSLEEVVDEEGNQIFPGGNYPDSIADTEKQRYKNYLAQDDAAYIEFEGNYTSQNGFRYRIRYRIYVGANPVDDFTIKPNCQYKNNITITGITVNNYGDEALLDTRVNIDEDTPAFIEMLRERQFDAHFNVTPMDIYLNEEGAQVTVAILNENGEPAQEGEMEWIRMEPYYHAPKDKCDYKDDEDGYAALRAGDGKRKYFTEDLLSELDEKAYSRLYTVTNSEERIYFYVDENVPTRTQYKQRQNVEPRTATIRITYKVGDNEISREAIFVQTGMKIVEFNKFNDSYYGNNNTHYWFYIEEHEEYLAHYDGKNEYTDTYEGLEWGLTGLESGLGASVVFGSEIWYEYMTWGWYNTIQIMNRYRDWYGHWRGHEMTLNEKPSGAAEYCYNKNKRKEDGSVGYVEWFLPTISEMEYAMDRYYTDYDEFKDNFYWSSNPGAEGFMQGGISVGNRGENVNYARATKVVSNDGTRFSHVESAVNQTYPNYTENGETKEGGSALRTMKFRIRAAYIPEEVKPGVVH